MTRTTTIMVQYMFFIRTWKHYKKQIKTQKNSWPINISIGFSELKNVSFNLYKKHVFERL